MDFSNKVVIITGASSGIGAATAILFAKHSANLALVGRNEENLKKVASQCENKKVKVISILAELSDDKAVENIVTQTINHFGRVDVLVNNAGIGMKAGIRDGIEPYDRAMTTNMRAVYLLTSIATPYLVRSKGNVVNVSSVAAFRPIADVNFLPYCISKAALDQFTRCVAAELGHDGVRVNSVNPGCTRTPFIENAGFSKDQAEQIYDSRNELYPLRKVTTSEEVADLILFLASDRARSITGSTYVIDNGELLV